MLFLIFLVARRLTNSPFGLALRGIRENSVRMPAIGAPSAAHIRKVYTMSAAIAGIAGALLAQTTSTVSLGVLDFQRSADVLVMLVLGGAGMLYGGLIGAVIFMVARDQFSGINPQYWYFWIGLLLVVVVMLLPNGILGGLSQLYRMVVGRAHMTAPALSTRKVNKSFGQLRGRARYLDRDSAWRTLRADRPERRRQDHADQSDDRHAAAGQRPDPARRRRHHRSQARRSASSAALHAPSRSTPCFPISPHSKR